MEHPTGSVDSCETEHVKRQITQAMNEGFGPPKAMFSLPDSDSDETDTDEIPPKYHTQTVSTIDDNESDNNESDDSESDDIGTENVRTNPVPIPGAIYRNRSLEEMKKASLECLKDTVEEYTIGFNLTAFPEAIAKWIPRLRATALPGSYEHMLLLMFDDVKEFNKFQTTLRESGVPNSLQPRRDGTLATNPRRSGRGAIGRGKGRNQSKTILVPKGRTVPNIQTTDEVYFARELHILRLMVAPLRDENKEIVWITSREAQPDDMIQQFDAAKTVIDTFKKLLIKAMHEGPENSK